MSGNRSRMARSSSMGEIGMLSQVRPIDAPKAIWGKKVTPAAVGRPVQKFSKPSVAKPVQPCRKILTISSPVRDWNVENPDSNSDDGRVGGFLEACYLCKKKIAETDEVFMYSYLRAFCSCKCRDQHIASDRGTEKSTADATEIAILRHWERILGGRLGAQKPKI